MELLSEHFDGSRILITGGCGFIGSTLVRKLLRETNCFVFNLDKMGYASDLSLIEETLQHLGEKHFNRHKLFKTDLINQSEVDSVNILANPDYVIHLTAESHVDNSIENPKLFIDSNIIGTYNILEAVKNHYLSMKK